MQQEACLQVKFVNLQQNLKESNLTRTRLNGKEITLLFEKVDYNVVVVTNRK